MPISAGIRPLSTLVLFSTLAPAFAQDDAFRLTSEALRDAPRVTLTEGWEYLPAGAPDLVPPGPGGGGWSAVRTRMRRGQIPEDWTGLGWFRLRLEIPEELVHVPLALGVRQSGASEIYLDGELLASYGTIGSTAEDTVPETPLESRVFQFGDAGEHELAVRYANPRPRAFVAAGWDAGFRMTLGLANRAVPLDVSIIHTSSGHVWLFTGIFLSFALLHFLLFAFYPETRENLYLALLCVSAAALFYLLLQKVLMRDPRFVLFSEPVMNVAGLALVGFALRFIYGVFSERLPRLFFVFLAIAAGLALWSLFRPADALTWVFLAMLAGSLEMIRSVAVALWKKKPGAVLLGAGIAALGAGFTVGLLANLGILPRTAVLGTLVPFSSIVVLLVSMSVHLSHQFAKTNRELRAKLMEVERLSEEKLRREVEKKLLEARYEQKVRELEEARELQLSMLPKRVPQLPDLEIAAFMATATEVGGDYYDFHEAEDGTLTVAIGDATGHGMKAGTMVTATKSLFNVLAQESDLLATLNRSAVALKRMNLRKLAMALTLIQIKDRQLRLAAAGMPPAFIYRAGTREVQSVLLAGMPLGSLAGFPYREEALRLDAGDVILLMSDGFPERLNPDDEMLTYERAVASFSEAAGEPAQGIIDRLVAAGDKWAEGRPTEDDVTFVVLKVIAK